MLRLHQHLERGENFRFTLVHLQIERASLEEHFTSLMHVIDIMKKMLNKIVVSLRMPESFAKLLTLSEKIFQVSMDLDFQERFESNAKKNLFQ